MTNDNTVPFPTAGDDKKITVPFSPDNLSKAPTPRHIIFTLGPMPHPAAMSVAAQSMDQGWSVVAVCFAGQVQASRIVGAGQQPISIYFVSICKVFCEGEEIIRPEIMMPDNGKK